MASDFIGDQVEETFFSNALTPYQYCISVAMCSSVAQFVMSSCYFDEFMIVVLAVSHPSFVMPHFLSIRSASSFVSVW